MPLLKSAIKRMRQSERRRVRNQITRTRIKNISRKVLEAVQAKNATKAKEALVEAQSVMGKASKRHLVHWKTAARKISRLSQKVHNLAV